MRRFYPFHHDSSPRVFALFPAGPSPHLLDQLGRLKAEIAALEREVDGAAPKGRLRSARRPPPRTWRDAL